MSATEESLTDTSMRGQHDLLQNAGDLASNEFPPASRAFPTTSAVTSSSKADKGRKGSGAVFFVLATALLGGLLSWLWAANQGERYSATAVVQLEPSSTIEESRDVVDVLGSLDRGPIIVTAAGLANSGLVKSAAREKLGLSSADVENYEVESLQVLTSHLIDITVTGPNEARSIAYADAIAEELQVSFVDSYPVYQIPIVTPASVPDSSGRPGVIVIVIAAMIASAIGAFMLWLALFGGSDERTDLPMTRRS